MEKQFELNAYSLEKDVIIYGAGTIGEYVYKLLNKQGIKASLFCDRLKSGQKYFGVSVISPDAVGAYASDAYVLIAASGDQAAEIIAMLHSQGIHSYYGVSDLLRTAVFEKGELTENASDYRYNIDNYLWNEEKRKSRANVLKISSVDLVITQKCSMKCRNCCNLMQYYQNPKDAEFDKTITSFYRFLEFVDDIYNVYIIGGEPFINKEIYRYIDALTKFEKIRNITVFTNATILPNENKLKAVVSPKLRFSISNYGALSQNFSGLCSLLDKLKIQKNIFASKYWYDLGELKEHNYTDEEIKKVYSGCFCRALTFMNGKLYICPYSAHGRALEAIREVNEDVIDFSGDGERGIRNVRDRIQNFIYHKTADLACKYCNGKNTSIPMVKSAIQIEEPLEYERQ